MDNNKFFSNKNCEYYPCHKIDDNEEFNCLFCYCPLYVLGKECGGDFVYLDNGIKDCSNCILPHGVNSASYIESRWTDILAIVK